MCTARTRLARARRCIASCAKSHLARYSGISERFMRSARWGGRISSGRSSRQPQNSIATSSWAASRAASPRTYVPIPRTRCASCSGVTSSATAGDGCSVRFAIMRAVLSTSGEPKAVLVTGGAGFIGSHLVRRLLSYEYRVRVFDNFATGKEQNLEGLEELEVVKGDIRSRADVARSMRGMNAVFHLAALPSVARSWKDPVTTLATNAHGTANVVEAALDNGVDALVYSSSSSVYGDQEAEKKSEDLELKPISPYGYSKLLGEKIALAHARGNGGLRVVALRYFNVFGARQDPDSPYAAVIPLFIKHEIGRAS